MRRADHLAWEWWAIREHRTHHPFVHGARGHSGGLVRLLRDSSDSEYPCTFSPETPAAFKPTSTYVSVPTAAPEAAGRLSGNPPTLRTAKMDAVASLLPQGGGGLDPAVLVSTVFWAESDRRTAASDEYSVRLISCFRPQFVLPSANVSHSVRPKLSLPGEIERHCIPRSYARS